jgi:hypothetical protein
MIKFFFVDVVCCYEKKEEEVGLIELFYGEAVESSYRDWKFSFRLS